MQLQVFLITFVSVLIAPIVHPTDNYSARAELPILAFIPWNSSIWANGAASLPAALEAIEDINNNAAILPDYYLSLRYSLSSDTGCTTVDAVKHYMKYKRLNETPVAIFGPGCSQPALKVASLVSQPGEEVVQVSYGATNPILSNAKSYPFFFRTVPSQLELVDALASFVVNGNWTHVFAFYQGSDSILRSTALSFVAAPLLQFTVRNPPQLRHLQGSTEADIKSVLDAIRSINYEPIIIFAFVESDLITDILDGACDLSMNSADYVWVFPEQYGDWAANWTGCNCGSNSSDSDWPLIFQTQYLIYQANPAAILGNQTVEQKISILEHKIQKFANFSSIQYNVNFEPGADNFSYAAYDAMWAIAIALNLTDLELAKSSLSLRNYALHQSNVSAILQDIIRHTVNFEGLSGRVSFQSGNSKQPVLLQRVNCGGRYYEKAFMFFNGSLTPLADIELPVDDFVLRSYNIHHSGFVIVLLVAGLALVVSTILAGINIFYRKRRVVRSTSPAINLFIISAHYLLILFAVLLSVIHYCPDILAEDFGEISCNFLGWLLSLGCSLIITPLFVKYFRLYLVFSARYRSGLQAKLNDFKLSLIVVVVVFLADVVPLVVLIGVAPLRTERTDVTSTEGDRTQVIQCSIQLDLSKKIKFGFAVFMLVWLLLCNLLVVLFLLLSTFRLRNITVHRELFNDSGSVFLFMILESLTFIVCTLILFIPNLKPIPSFNIRYYVLVCAVMTTVFLSIAILFFYKYRTVILKLFQTLLRRNRDRQDSIVSPEVYTNQMCTRQRFPSFVQGLAPPPEIPQDRSRASLLSLPLRRLSTSTSSLSSPFGSGSFAASAWYARNRRRTSSFSMSSPPPFPHSQRNSVNSVHFSPTPPEVAFFVPDSWSPFQRRLSSIASIASDTSDALMYDPYYS